MDRLKFKRWTIRYDKERTTRAYEGILQGGAEECACANCLNYLAGRDAAFPVEVHDLFARLGIDIAKDAEPWWRFDDEEGNQNYMVTYHLVGSLEEGDDAHVKVPGDEIEVYHAEYEEVSPTCTIGFTNLLSLVPDSFEDAPVVQVEVTVMMPWVIG